MGDYDGGAVLVAYLERRGQKMEQNAYMYVFARSSGLGLSTVVRRLWKKNGRALGKVTLKSLGIPGCVTELAAQSPCHEMDEVDGAGVVEDDVG